ncbi:MAG: hypothetical protein RJB13_239 [Pseudomonadota bacterium]|jgi:hypothetical protein
MWWKGPSLVRPAVVDICSRPVVVIVAIKQLAGAGWCDGTSPHRETQCAQRCCDGGLIKHNAHEFHAPAAFVAFEHVDFESAFEKLCPGDAFCLSGKYLRCAERQEKSKKLITFDIRIVWSEILGFAATQNAGFMLC